MPTSAELNAQFGAADSILFEDGPNGLLLAKLTSPNARAVVALDGAQVLEYIPGDQPPVLFVSEQAQYQVGKSVRGGVPVCWPWFGGVRNDPQHPFHGFARMVRWDVRATDVQQDTAKLELGLSESEFTRQYWSHSFVLRLVITLATELRLDLIARNTDSVPVELTAALHSYFRVGDIDAVTIHGLENTQYLDKRDDGREKQQLGPIAITEATDRIYLDTKATYTIEDRSLDRRIVIEKQGSNSAVVWNPWADDARAMSDMRDDEYQAMVCVETTNAGDDIITLPPGEEHRLSVVIRAESL